MDEIIAPATLPMTNAKRVVRALVPRTVRNWLRSPAVSLRWFWDEVRFLCGGRTVVEMRPGWSLTCHPAAYRCAYSVQETDPDQVAEFDGFVRNCSPGMILLDIGAHFGLFSFAALHYGGPQARSIAVDPSATAFRFLNVQAKLNAAAERLHVIQSAVSDCAGWQNMVAVGVVASGYYVGSTAGYPPGDLCRTKAVTLDDIVEELGMTPTHIKIDVEGHEAAVLRGGRRVFSQAAAPLLFLEIHNEIVCGMGGSPADTLTLLSDYGYETFTPAEIPIAQRAVLASPLIRIIARKRSFEDSRQASS